MNVGVDENEDEIEDSDKGESLGGDKAYDDRESPEDEGYFGGGTSASLGSDDDVLTMVEELVAQNKEISDEEVPPIETAQAEVEVPVKGDLEVEAEMMRRGRTARKAALAAQKKKSGASGPATAKKVRVDPIPVMIDVEVTDRESQNETCEVIFSHITRAGTSSPSAGSLPLEEVMRGHGIDSIFADHSKVGVLATLALQFPADAGMMPQNLGDALSLAQRAIPQRFMAFNAAPSFLVRSNKELKGKLQALAPTSERLQKEKNDLEVQLKTAEDRAAKVGNLAQCLTVLEGQMGTLEAALTEASACHFVLLCYAFGFVKL